MCSKGPTRKRWYRRIRAVAQGEALFGPAIAARLHTFFATPQPATLLPVFPDLTERERDVLTLLAQGLNNGDIARQLHISPKTVRNHCSNISGELPVVDRAQAIIRPAGMLGWVKRPFLLPPQLYYLVATLKKRLAITAIG